jgi:hypothetical protein
LKQKLLLILQAARIMLILLMAKLLFAK